MKKLILFTVLLFCGIVTVSAQKKAEIKLEESTHHFGEFVVDSLPLVHEFTFTNVGEQPLIIHQTMPSCGCTVAEYTKEPVKPGEKGTIKVTYNSKAKGYFNKFVTIRTNGVVELAKVYIDGTCKE